MKKKEYIVPTVKVKTVGFENSLLVDSKLNSDDDNPVVTPTPDPWDDEFGANGSTIWDE